MTGIAVLACVALALSATCARLLAPRHRLGGLGARSLATLSPGARQLAAHVGTLSGFRLPLPLPSTRQPWRRARTLLIGR